MTACTLPRGTFPVVEQWAPRHRVQAGDEVFGMRPTPWFRSHSIRTARTAPSCTILVGSTQSRPEPSAGRPDRLPGPRRHRCCPARQRSSSPRSGRRGHLAVRSPRPRSYSSAATPPSTNSCARWFGRGDRLPSVSLHRASGIDGCRPDSFRLRRPRPSLSVMRPGGTLVSRILYPSNRRAGRHRERGTGFEVILVYDDRAGMPSSPISRAGACAPTSRPPTHSPRLPRPRPRETGRPPKDRG